VVGEAIKARRARGLATDNLFYWHSHDGLEVDLVVEHGRQLTPIEIKATTSPRPTDLEAIERFRTLAASRAEPGTLVHFGTERATLRGHRLIPWTAVDAIPTLSG
jgi:hypothetical protein